MKSFKFLLLIIFFIVSCSDTESDVQEINETVANETTAIDNEIIWSQGIGKSPGEFVSNWNKLIDSISDDQDTITFFSIDPDGVYQVSNEKETLVYRFGNSRSVKQTNGKHKCRLNYIPTSQRSLSVMYLFKVLQSRNPN